MIDDLSEFLLARIAEIERLAKDAAPGPWTVIELYDDVFCLDDASGSTVAEESSNGCLEPENARHIAYWNPTHAVTECEAKRLIIEWCKGAIEAGEIKPGTSWNDDAAGGVLARRVLRLMALPYADHPDYRQEWKP